MKICLINNLYGQYARSGAEKVVEKIAAELQNKGDEVFIISSCPLGKKNKIASLHSVSLAMTKIYYLPSEFFELDKMPIFLRFFWHIGNVFSFINYSKIKKILKKERPDLIWTHNLLGLGFLVFLLPKKLKIRHRHTLHDIQLLHPSGLMFYKKEGIINTPWAKIYQALNKFFIQSPDEVVSPSRWLLDLHLEKGFFKNSKTKVEPNFKIEKKVFNRQPPTANFQFLYVGQIEKHKGVKNLIEAFQKITRKNISLSIIGSGSLSDEIKKMSAPDERIKILGQKTGEEVKQTMKNSNCLVVPSLCYENSPTVIYEAFSAGLPVLASRLGGIVELVDKTNGLLFSPGDKKDLMEKMEAFCVF